MLFSDLEDVKVRSTEDGYRVSGKVLGEKFDPGRHIAKIEVKAATYSQLRADKLDQTKGQYQWVAQCIIDI